MAIIVSFNSKIKGPHLFKKKTNPPLKSRNYKAYVYQFNPIKLDKKNGHASKFIFFIVIPKIEEEYLWRERKMRMIETLKDWIGLD